MAARPTALIADDEPLLRDRLAGLLASLWPELQVCGFARNGAEAVALHEQLRPSVCFLDVHMPGMNGIEAARAMQHAGTQLVFVTAYERYAVEAFARGAVDYLVKPVDPDRLAETVQRLRGRLASAQPAQVSDEVLQALARLVQAPPPPAWLHWIKASVGNAVRLIPVEQVVYLRSDHKYTVVVWEEGEAVIRKTIREMAGELDPARFAQIHRSAIVNLAHVAQFAHIDDAGEVTLKGRTERLPVSRSYLGLFQRM